MAITARTLCLCLAVLLAAVAAFGWNPPRGNLLAAAVAFLALAGLVP